MRRACGRADRARRTALRGLLAACLLAAASIPAIAQTADHSAGPSSGSAPRAAPTSAAPATLAAPQAGAPRTDIRPAGTLVWLATEPDHLELWASVDPAVTEIASKIYEGLLEYGPDLRPVGALAEDWEVARDQRSITFWLRRDVLFHDGSALTSADVRYSILDAVRRQHPRAAALLGALAEVATPDARTVVLRLSTPAPHLLYALAGHQVPILPRGLLERSASQRRPEQSQAPTPKSGQQRPPSSRQAVPAIGTGPFRLASWQPGVVIRLERNASYWRAPLPHLQAIEVRFPSSEAAALAMLEQETAHLAGPSVLSLEAAHRLRSNAAYEVLTTGHEHRAGVASLVFNLGRPPFDRREVREAVAISFDRAAAASAVWLDFARPAGGPLPLSFTPRGFPAPIPVTPVGAEAIERAGSLLDRAGLAKAEDGVRLRIEHEVAALGPQWQRLAEHVELQLARIGIKVTQRYERPAAWLDRVYQRRDFTLATTLSYGLSDPSLALHRTLHGAMSRAREPFANASGWSNRTADEILDHAASLADGPERSSLYDRLQRLVMTELPILPIAELTPPIVVHRQLRDVIAPRSGLDGSFAAARFEAPREAPRAEAAAAAPERR